MNLFSLKRPADAGFSAKGEGVKTSSRLAVMFLCILTILLAGCATQNSQSKTASPGAPKGNPKAEFTFATHFANGDGVPQDYAKAAQYLRLAAEQGYAPAQNNLGALYAQGLGVPQDYAEALKWFRRAADQGDALAQYSLGMMYAFGNGVPTNATEAIKWYQKAAAKHQLDAELGLADLYLGGRGIPADYQMALKWSRAAASQNSSQALNTMGFIYEQGGNGVPKDVPKALDCYRRAAAKGDGKAQGNLGRMYLEAIGVQRDPVEACKWFLLAVRNNGGGMARHFLEELQGNASYGDLPCLPLTEDEQKEALRRAKEYQKTILDKKR